MKCKSAIGPANRSPALLTSLSADPVYTGKLVVLLGTAVDVGETSPSQLSVGSTIWVVVQLLGAVAVLEEAELLVGTVVAGLAVVGLTVVVGEAVVVSGNVAFAAC